MGINEIRETTESCKHCYMCRHACPTFLATKLDSHTPRGYALLLSEIDHGFQDFTPKIVDRFYQCSQCGLCREDCAYHWAEDEVVRNAREEIVKRNKAPERVVSIAQRILSSGSPYKQAAKTVRVSSAKTESTAAEVLYFAGCSTRQSHPEIVSALDKVLGKLKIPWTIFEDEGCCGTPLWELGYSEEAKKVGEAAVNRISRLNPSLLLTGCPHCAKAFIELYPLWGVPFPKSIKVMHTSQYFAQLLEEGKLKLRVTKEEQVSYHDPCQLGRKLDEYEKPRRLLEALTGAAPIELFHHRAAAECCGAGSVMFLTDPDISEKVAARRMDTDLVGTNRTLITACQNCKAVFSQVAGRDSKDHEVMDLIELIAQAM
jgi:glycolate oxidase